MRKIRLSDADHLATVQALALTTELFAQHYGNDHVHTRTMHRALKVIAGRDGDAAREIFRPVVAKAFRVGAQGGAE